MPEHFNPTEWITTKEAGELTGCDPAHIRRLIQNGVFDTNKVGLVEKTSLHDFQESLALVLHWYD